MNNREKIILGVSALVLAGFSIAQARDKETDHLISSPHVIVSFEKGSDTLSKESQDKITELVKKEKSIAPESDFEIVAWSDHSTSTDRLHLAETDQTLAQKRLDVIANFLMARHISNVRAFNAVNYFEQTDKPKASNSQYPPETNGTAEPQVYLSKAQAPLAPNEDVHAVLREGGPSKAIVVAMRKTVHK